MWELFDVLMDADYRPLWDTNMIESYTVGYINSNNDLGYYASMYSKYSQILLLTRTNFFFLCHSVVPSTYPESRFRASAILVSNAKKNNSF